MFKFRLNPFAVLLELTPILCEVGQKFDIIATPTRLTLMLSHSSPNSFIVSLQMSPQFFNLYESIETCHFRFPLERFYVIMYLMEIQGYSSMLFSIIANSNTLSLTFADNANDKKPKETLGQLKLLPYELKLDCNIDYTTFVSIDSQAFKRVVSELNAYYVYVTLSNSRVKFSNQHKEITFNNKERRSIIGGVKGTQEFRFVITLLPFAFFLDLSNQSRRVWLFMQSDFSSIMILPCRMWSQFLVNFPGTT